MMMSGVKCRPEIERKKWEILKKNQAYFLLNNYDYFALRHYFHDIYAFCIIILTTVVQTYNYVKFVLY